MILSMFIILILLSNIGYAQDLQFEDIENSDIVELLTEQREMVNEARTRVIKPPAPPLPESRPKAYRAVIPQGTVLTRLSDNKDFFAAKRIQVWAQEEYAGSQTTYILNKDKETVFSARSINIVSIENDINLFLNRKIFTLETFDCNLNNFLLNL